MRKGLVLEGGAMRGLFSAGILDVLLEENITFDGVVGVSAGAAFGINMVSKQKGRPIRYNKRFARDWRYCSVRSWIKTGDLYGAKFAYHDMPNIYDLFDNETFENSKTEFHVVCTDVKTGEAVYKRLPKGGDTCYEWIRASASMPMVSRPVALEDKLLLDGGVADSIPLQYFEQQGFDRNIVVLTQPDGYVKKHNKLMPLMRLSLRKYPKMIDALDHRHEMYNKELEYVHRREKEGKALVIRPEAPLTIGHISHDPEEMQAAYDIGYQLGQKKKREILEFMNLS